MTWEFAFRQETFPGPSASEWERERGPSAGNTPALFGSAQPRPAANVVDEEAAEPIFSGRVRVPKAPLLDAATLKKSSQFNQATHPNVSGVTLAELRARLERYIDAAELDILVRRANAGTTGPYGADDAARVTLLAHQFQFKTCRTPSIGTITKRCTVEGRVAEDTLDALGFVYHNGRTLNAADRTNRIAAANLSRLPSSAFAGIVPGLAARTWWTYMVSPPWLGLPIKNGIHLILLRQLRRAQRALLNLPAYAGLSPAELGRALGLEEEHKGARPSSADWSMHLFGLGIDISYTRNPWLSNPQRDTAELAAITRRAARLAGPSVSNQPGITAALLHDLAITHRDTAKIHKLLANWSQWLAEYFTLGRDAQRLEGRLPTANVIYPDGSWFKRGESLASAAKRWSGIVRTDFDTFAKAVSRGDKANEVRHGFMDLARDLVIALRDDACLGWGAVDFGPAASGDIMHFDCRVEGIGRAIAQAARRPFVPNAGHPCLPAGGGSPVQTEFEAPVRKKKTPAPTPKPAPPTPGHWLTPFTSSAIPKYKDARGKLQSTASAVYVPDVAWKQNTIDLLVFFHGDLSPCAATFNQNPKDNAKKFSLDAQIHASGRKLALAVPAIHWIAGKQQNMLGNWTAANLNTFVDEVLAVIGSQSGVKPALGRLIIAGHSHAYAILTPLACEFDKDAAPTKSGALAKLSEVWALDSTYAQWHVHALDIWARKRASLRLIAVLSKNGAPWSNWNGYYSAGDYCPSGFQPPKNLKMCTVDDGPGKTHCIMPSKYVRMLLSPTLSWCK